MRDHLIEEAKAIKRIEDKRKGYHISSTPSLPWILVGGYRRHQAYFFSFSFVISWLPCLAKSLTLGIECKFSSSNALLILV